MAALTLYTETLRMLLQYKGNDVSWVPIYETFCDLRESLLCGVCRKLLIVPYQRYTSICSHNVCRNCIGRKLQIPCIWCDEDKKFEDNVHLRVLLQSFKTLCKFIISCDFFNKYLLSDLSLSKLNFIRMVTEGSKLADDYKYKCPQRIPAKRLRRHYNPEPDNITPEITHNENITQTVYRICLSDDQAGSQNNMQGNNPTFPLGIPSYVLKKSYVVTQKTCNCGVAPMSPTNQACLGQKCPCFASERACFNCRCQGCKNPRKYRACPIRFVKYKPPGRFFENVRQLENRARIAAQTVQEQLQTDQEQNQADQEQHQADQEQHQADQEQHQADQEQHLADQEKHQADQEQNQADQEQHQADQEQHQADQEQHQADQEQHLAGQDQHQADQEQPQADQEYHQADQVKHQAIQVKHQAVQVDSIDDLKKMTF